MDLRDTLAVDVFSEELKNKDYDLVIFTAGIGYHRKFSELSSDEIIEQISVNTLAPLQIIK